MHSEDTILECTIIYVVVHVNTWNFQTESRQIGSRWKQLMKDGYVNGRMQLNLLRKVEGLILGKLEAIGRAFAFIQEVFTFEGSYRLGLGFFEKLHSIFCSRSFYQLTNMLVNSCR